MSEDGVVEAISAMGNSFVYDVQWHPEFHGNDNEAGFLDSTLLLDKFLHAAKK